MPGEQPQDRRYIKLNTNENPYPPSPQVVLAIKNAAEGDLRRYPDPSARELRQKAAEVYGVPPEQIIAGNGSDDLLSILFRVCVEGGAPRQVAYPVPTYSLYDTLAAIQGAPPTTVPFPADFALPIEALVAADARVTIVCNPNSPSGTAVPVSDIAALAERTSGLVVVDEAYVDFARESALSLLGTCSNVLVLRTFSKSFSLAGMRVGLGFARREIIDELNKVKDSYNLNRVSLLAAQAALEDLPWMNVNVARVRAARETLSAELLSLGFLVLPSAANFIFAKCPRLSGKDVYTKLRERGILVRHFAAPLLSEGVRITVGSPEENAALVDALRAILAVPEVAAPAAG